MHANAPNFHVITRIIVRLMLMIAAGFVIAAVWAVGIGTPVKPYFAVNAPDSATVYFVESDGRYTVIENGLCGNESFFMRRGKSTGFVHRANIIFGCGGEISERRSISFGYLPGKQEGKALIYSRGDIHNGWRIGWFQQDINAALLMFGIEPSSDGQKIIIAYWGGLCNAKLSCNLWIKSNPLEIIFFPANA